MSLNPAQSSVTAEKPNGAAAKPELTDEFLQDLIQNPSKASGLDRETRQRVLKRMGDMEETGFEQTVPDKEKAAEEKKPAETQAEKKPETETKPEGKVEEKPSELPFDVRQARKRHQELVDEANRWEQKLKTAQVRREKATKAFEEIQKAEVKPPDDFLDDKYQGDLKTRLERSEKAIEFLKAQLEDRDKDEIEELTTQRHSREEDKIFSEIDTLQARFPELKTSKPFKHINAEYAGWVDSMVTALGKQPSDSVSYDDLRKEALEKYQSEQSFRDSVKAKPPEEIDKLRIILSVHHRKLQSGGSYKSNYLDLLDDDDVLETTMQKGRAEAAKDAARETVKAMKKSEEEITTLSPTDGTSKGGTQENDFSPAAMTSFLETIQAKLSSGIKLTPEDRAKMKLFRDTTGKSPE